LPEAQLDRFLMKIRVSYPEDAQESQLLARYQDGFEARSLDRAGLQPVAPEALQAARAETARVRVEPKLLSLLSKGATS